MAYTDEYHSSKRRHRKKKISRKKQKRIHNIKKGFHKLFSFLLLLAVFPALYFLVWGLIIEPNLPRHIYGPGDFKEFIYLLSSLTLLLFSYVMIRIINYEPLNMAWWDNIKLLYSVGFNLEKYTAMKQMGIKYSHQKKKKRHQLNKNYYSEHKSITE